MDSFLLQNNMLFYILLYKCTLCTIMLLLIYIWHVLVQYKMKWNIIENLIYDDQDQLFDKGELISIMWGEGLKITILKWYKIMCSCATFLFIKCWFEMSLKENHHNLCPKYNEKVKTQGSSRLHNPSHHSFTLIIFIVIYCIFKCKKDDIYLKM